MSITTVSFDPADDEKSRRMPTIVKEEPVSQKRQIHQPKAKKIFRKIVEDSSSDDLEEPIPVLKRQNSDSIDEEDGIPSEHTNIKVRPPSSRPMPPKASSPGSSKAPVRRPIRRFIPPPKTNSISEKSESKTEQETKQNANSNAQENTAPLHQKPLHEEEDYEYVEEEYEEETPPPSPKPPVIYQQEIQPVATNTGHRQCLHFLEDPIPQTKVYFLSKTSNGIIGKQIQFQLTEGSTCVRYTFIKNSRKLKTIFISETAKDFEAGNIFSSILVCNKAAFFSLRDHGEYGEEIFTIKFIENDSEKDRIIKAVLFQPIQGIPSRMFQRPPHTTANGTSVLQFGKRTVCPSVKNAILVDSNDVEVIAIMKFNKDCLCLEAVPKVPIDVIFTIGIASFLAP